MTAPISATEDGATPERFYNGLAVANFDGILQVLDSRGATFRAKLITTVGRVEIDCVLNKARIPEIRQLFDQRVRIEGTAHYDGIEQLPVRVDVHDVVPIKSDADLLRWRGAFQKGDAKEDW